ncbi:sulfate ABC transporter permease subunit CysW [Microbispora corallina]|uniref:Sulfate ABC transporter permease subunit CysW n=1 Tax=Microbispora corallina TaxID=83302 RepID=A0ABQ4G9J3_9ACTN|nr:MULTISPECIES: sulfate ABC transporter permease subunit [Microbispora]ETK35142.1 sulfate ABC transporter [Microbispora sp. ATCC PTA-5024]GIH43689.1 sulfate ABC transporter permease subunit CysW [Microbispora corallina]
MAKYALRALALVYLLFLLVLPVALIVWRTFGDGFGPFAEALTSPSALHAFQVTLTVAVWAVVANTLFGIGVSILLVRHSFPGKRLLNAFIDLPMAVSPVVVGLALILVYGRFAPVGGLLESWGIQVIFSTPGMVLATVFVSLPLVVRAVVPVLEELGDEQEQAAHTLGASRFQAFLRITLPGIRWALGYGVVLCLARSLGEYGAVAVVSGRLVDQTQTLTLFVEERFQNFDQPAAFAAATALALIAVVTLLLTKLLRPKD